MPRSTAIVLAILFFSAAVALLSWRYPSFRAKLKRLFTKKKVETTMKPMMGSHSTSQPQDPANPQ